MLFMIYLVRRAPVLEDVPYDAVVAEPREEVEDGVARRQLAALGEAADGEDVSVEAPSVALVAAVLADAMDEGLDLYPMLVSRQSNARLQRFSTFQDILGGSVLAGSQGQIDCHCLEPVAPAPMALDA